MTGGPYVAFTVATVPSPTTFTYPEIKANATLTGGTVELYWPLAQVGPTPDYFTVETAPTPTTFTVPISYADGTWTGGTVSFAWDGTFFVNGVPSATSFTYLQYGPNATSTTVGTVTP